MPTLEEALEACRVENEKLRGALEPFLRATASFDAGRWDDETKITVEFPTTKRARPVSYFYAEDVKRARAAQALAAHREREGRDSRADLSSAKRADHDGERSAGWVLVPREPTEAMVCAGDGKDPGFGSLSAAIYRAMLAAAPTLSGPQSEEGEG